MNGLFKQKARGADGKVKLKSPYFYLRFMSGGRMYYHNTKQTTLRGAELVATRFRGKFFKEQEERAARAEALGCDIEAIAQCPVCDKLFDSTYAVATGDTKKVCSEPCRALHNAKLAPIPTLHNYLTNTFLPDEREKAELKGKTNAYYAGGVSYVLADTELPNLRLDDVTSEHIERFVSRLRGRKTRRGVNFSPSAINMPLRTLRHALRRAKKKGLIKFVPEVSLEREPKRRRSVADDLFFAYLDLCGHLWSDWHDLAIVLRFQGVRPWSEAAPLRWQNVHLAGDNPYIAVMPEGEDTLKTESSERKLALHPAAFEVLARRHKQQKYPERGFVWPAGTKSGHVEGHRCAHTRALRLLRAAHEAFERTGIDAAAQVLTPTLTAKEARAFVARHAVVLKRGVDSFRPYDLRHTALTDLATTVKADVFTLARIAGHTKITMTQHYVNPQQEAINDAFAKFGKLKPLPVM